MESGIETTIVICIDTSGSIVGNVMGTFVTECRAILDLAGITAVVISADAKVQQTIQPGETFPTVLMGGGGTSFVPALEAAANYEPDGIVYFTDGEGTYTTEFSISSVVGADKAMCSAVWRKNPSGGGATSVNHADQTRRTNCRNQKHETFLHAPRPGNAGQILVDIHNATPKGKWAPTLRGLAARIVAENIPLVQEAVDKHLRENQYPQWVNQHLGQNNGVDVKARYNALPVTPDNAISVPMLTQVMSAWERRGARRVKGRALMAEREAREAEQLVLCRTRILNQVELAFLKSERSAAKYITCSGTRYSERCDAPAKVLCLTHEIPARQ